MASNLPDYVASAKPVPPESRIPWYKSTAQTYAGIMLWFVFWISVPMGEGTRGGTLTQGFMPAFIGLVAAALFCHVFYYLAPGMLGLKTGLPLYIVGTSTYGVRGGFLMPGFLMGILQFGWLGVNAYWSSLLLAAPLFEGGEKIAAEGGARGTVLHMAIGAVWAVAAAFMGLKGIKYVARVATFFPVIPLAILLILVAVSAGGLGSFSPVEERATAMDLAQKDASQRAIEMKGPNPTDPLTSEWAVIATLLTVIIGFFATAGAAGTDFGMNNRDARDVQYGGLVGIAGATIFAGGLALLIVAGAHGLGKGIGVTNPTELMPDLVGDMPNKVFKYLLAIAAFPPACFSAFIAANSFKTTLPKVNPFISVGLGTLVSILLVVTGKAGEATEVFVVIGASFGPICGAMAADYLLAGRQWAGPRAGFNPAGWLSWAVGFVVGAAALLAKYIGLLTEKVPALEHVVTGLKTINAYIHVPPLSAMIVGFVLYVIFSAIGLRTRTLEMPQAEAPPAA